LKFSLYLIVDCAHADVVDAALATLPPGAAAVQLRDKAATGAALYASADRLREVCRRRGAPLLVNDRADVAVALGLDGVHLPENGLPPEEARRLLGPARLVGVSRHDVPGLGAAEVARADFAVFGPVFATPGKGAPVGLDALREACAAVRMPVFALGGVEAANAHACARAGAAGVAVVRAVAEARAVYEAFTRRG
jgi:thiamine-phosphate pyrophosphorylase